MTYLLIEVTKEQSEVPIPAVLIQAECRKRVLWSKNPALFSYQVDLPVQ